MRAILLAALLCVAIDAQALELVCRTLVRDAAGAFEAVFEARWPADAIEFGDDGYPWVAVTFNGKRHRREIGENESCKIEATP